MDFEKLTDRARGFLQAAQTIAVREHHQRIAPAHYAEGAARRRAGHGRRPDQRGRRRRAGRAARSRCAGRQAAGGDRQRRDLRAGASTATSSACSTRPQEIAKKAGDSYVTVERILLAMALAKGTDVGDALAKAGLTPQTLNAAIDKLRGGRTADTQGAEDRYDALKKYARDLTEAAREGKLDPVIGRDEEIRRTIQVLARRTKNNPVLIGEPGVGKTAIAEGPGAAHRQWRRARRPQGPPAAERSTWAR